MTPYPLITVMRKGWHYTGTMLSSSNNCGIVTWLLAMRSVIVRECSLHSLYSVNRRLHGANRILFLLDCTLDEDKIGRSSQYGGCPHRPLQRHA